MTKQISFRHSNFATKHPSLCSVLYFDLLFELSKLRIGLPLFSSLKIVSKRPISTVISILVNHLASSNKFRYKFSHVSVISLYLTIHCLIQYHNIIGNNEVFIFLW
jgi:hypothetical protein